MSMKSASLIPRSKPYGINSDESGPPFIPKYPAGNKEDEDPTSDTQLSKPNHTPFLSDIKSPVDVALSKPSNPTLPLRYTNRPVQFIAHPEPDGYVTTFTPDDHDVGVFCPKPFSGSPLRRLPFSDAPPDSNAKPVLRPNPPPPRPNVFSQTPPHCSFPSLKSPRAEARTLGSNNVFAKVPPRLDLIVNQYRLKPYGLNQEWAIHAPSPPSKKLSVTALVEPPTSPETNGISAPVLLELPISLPLLQNWRLQRFETWDRTSYCLLTGMLWLIGITVVFMHPHACSFCMFVKPSYLNSRWTTYFVCSYVGVTILISGLLVGLVRYQRGRVWTLGKKGKFLLRIFCVLIGVFGDGKFIDWWSLVVSLCITLSTITLSFLVNIIDDVGLYEGTFAFGCAALRSTIGMNLFGWAVVGLLVGALLHLKCIMDARILARIRVRNVLNKWSQKIKQPSLKERNKGIPSFVVFVAGMYLISTEPIDTCNKR